MKFKTVRQGDQAVIFNHLGQGRLIEGPQRVFLFRERFHRLRKLTADRYEYVQIHMNNGTIVNKAGPCQVFENPLEVKQCSTEKAQIIDGNHLLVVYKRLANGESERRIIEGPAVFVPEADEWCHNFQWQGTHPLNKTRLVRDLNKFNQLPTIPGNFYYNVNDVRTCDDTILTVKIMLFYKMLDVLQMLNATHDPITDLSNAVCADIISFVGPLTCEQFVKRTNELSELSTYSQLIERAERMGFKIQKVVFRGYHASDQLQEMQSVAIESRTELRLQREIEDQEQKLANFKLNKLQERSLVGQAMEIRRQAHQQKVAELKQKHNLEMEELKLNHKLELSSAEKQVELESQEAQYKHKVQHLTKLTQANVDLTKYLTLESSTPAHDEIRITRVM